MEGRREASLSMCINQGSVWSWHAVIIFPSGALWAHWAPRVCPLALLCADIWWLSSHSSCSGRKGAAASCTPHHFQQSRSKDCAARLRSILQSPLQQLLTGSSREVCRGWKIWVAIEVLSYFPLPWAISLFLSILKRPHRAGMQWREFVLFQRNSLWQSQPSHQLSV